MADHRVPSTGITNGLLVHIFMQEPATRMFRGQAVAMNVFAIRRYSRVFTVALMLMAGLSGPIGAAVPSELRASNLPKHSLSTATPLPASLAWGWPLTGSPEVVRAFDPPAQPWLSGHRGVDLLALQGAEVLAPIAAVVTFSGVVVNREVLTLMTDEGLRLSFEPVVSSLRVGDLVARGQIIGQVQGPTHCESSVEASCLHWGVRRGEVYLDPLQFILDQRPSILLPLP